MQHDELDIASLSLQDRPDDRLCAAARANSPEGVMLALNSGATAVDTAMCEALANDCSAAMYMLLQRGALARTVGVLPSLLHRPGLEHRARARSSMLLLKYISESNSQAAYRSGVRDVLLAGACLREGPLLLADVLREGHLDSAFADADAAKDGALRDALRLNEKVRRVSWSSSGTNDAVVCGLVRTAVRKRYSGYDLARQQLTLALAGLHRQPWTPSVHAQYPASFRALVMLVLLCGQRPPLSNLPDGVLLLVVEQLARNGFWDEPLLDLDEGEDIDFHAHCRARAPRSQEDVSDSAEASPPKATSSTGSSAAAAASLSRRATSGGNSGSGGSGVIAGRSPENMGRQPASSKAGATRGRGKYWMQKQPSYATLA